MASQQLRADEMVETQAGTGPEYEYPTTGKDEPIPVVKDEEPVEEGTGPPVVGEEMPDFTDRDIQREEKMEEKEAGQWSEAMAENYPRPGEAEDLSPEEREILPSDRG